jgi:hypothetical protein
VRRSAALGDRRRSTTPATPRRFGKRSSARIYVRKSHPAIPAGSPRGSRIDAFGFEIVSSHQTPDHLRQFLARFGQGIEVVLPLTANRDDPAVPQQGEVMADGGLALVQLLA